MSTLTSLPVAELNRLRLDPQSEPEEDFKDGIWIVKDLKFCGPIPPHTPHGVSYFVPEWDAILQFLEENYDVIDKLQYGYPRVQIHEFVKQLNRKISSSLELCERLACFSFPSSRVAQECMEYLGRHAETPEQLDFIGAVRKAKYYASPPPENSFKELAVDYIIFHKSLGPLVHAFWQNSGEILSSRFAAYCLQISEKDANKEVIKSEARFYKGNRTAEASNHGAVYEVYLEKCLGESQAFEKEAVYKENIKSRIAAGLAAGETENIATSSDVFLFPTGMSSIYNTLRLAHAISEPARSVCFGFSYKDTKKVLSQFGPGCIFYGVGESEDLFELEKLLERERISMLICEFPTNPLLKSPDLRVLRNLADAHGFLLVVDDTLGNFINLQGLLIADVIVTSLTKIFSGYSDLMAGCLDEEQDGRYGTRKNSRSVEERARKVNQTSEALADFLKAQPLGSRDLFYDAVKLSKGPSLGTNFTLLVPYVLLAHYKELDVVKGYGVDSHQIRVSVGLEDVELLKSIFQEAFDYAASNTKVD
ncbi:Cystathionine gamma-synthase [Massospora cicadina]|nr:Cystathionine gamma-synthase [Massospora cicadina]